MYMYINISEQFSCGNASIYEDIQYGSLNTIHIRDKIYLVIFPAAVDPRFVFARSASLIDLRLAKHISDSFQIERKTLPVIILKLI